MVKDASSLASRTTPSCSHSSPSVTSARTGGTNTYAPRGWVEKWVSGWVGKSASEAMGGRGVEQGMAAGLA